MRASYIKRSTKKIPQVNVEATKRRNERRRAHYRSPEYKQLRTETFERDGHRCTFVACKVGGPQFAIGDSTHAGRCEATTKLHCHETSYRNRKAVTLCEVHHALVEATYYGHRRRGKFIHLALLLLTALAIACDDPTAPTPARPAQLPMQVPHGPCRLVRQVVNVLTGEIFYFAMVYDPCLTGEELRVRLQDGWFLWAGPFGDAP